MTAGIAAGAAAGAATGVMAGARENAAAGVSLGKPGACAYAVPCNAAMCAATNTVATAARLMQAILIGFSAIIIASFAFSWRQDEQQLRFATPRPS
ncbi:MAG: hypothetical protein WBE64_13655, partial [Xanthobacteraceae bacterium]